MRLYLPLLFALAVVLAGCTPAAESVIDRDGQTVVVTVHANETLYDATVTILNASTDDPRCVQFDDVDLGCSLGLIPAGETETVEVVSPAVHCVAYAYLQPGRLDSFRPFPCKVK